jgi:hypothetical protein
LKIFETFLGRSINLIAFYQQWCFSSNEQKFFLGFSKSTTKQNALPSVNTQLIKKDSGFEVRVSNVDGYDALKSKQSQYTFRGV